MREDNLESVTDLTPEILVVGPGGNKGFLFLGAIKYLIEEEFIEFIHTFVGCSVGSILSLLLVIEYPIDKITKLSFDTELVNEISLNSFVSNGGFSNSNHIINKLKVILYEKYECIPTFEELYQVTGKELSIVTYNLTHHKVECFNYKTTPNVKCLDAIKLSINMPLVYEKVKYNDCTYIDGAMGNPYPVDLYDNGKNVILGLYLDTVEKECDINIIPYIYNIIIAPIKIIRSMIIKNSSNKCVHIGLIYNMDSENIYSSGLKNKDNIISIKEKDKTKMLNFGYNYTKLFLESIYV